MTALNDVNSVVAVHHARECSLKDNPLYFSYGDERIAFERVKRPQATGKILIKVHPDCSVVVSAPDDADTAAVLVAVKKRARWIYEHLRDFRKQPHPDG